MRQARNSQPIGYARIIEDLSLRVIRPHRLSYVLAQGTPGTDVDDGRVTRYYPARQHPGRSLVAHLEFALKHEGVNLDVLWAAFRALGPGDLTSAVREKPFGKYLRKLWFLYEYLMREQLDVGDLGSGNYVPLLDPTLYFEGRHRKARRQRIINNLLGTWRFSPMVRRTPALAEREASDLSRRARDLLSGYEPNLIRRAVRYLYTKETRSSFAIEREAPSLSRMERFIDLIRRSLDEPHLSADSIVAMQNAIVDPRFVQHGYRTVQNYVGEAVAGSGRVHFVSPRPEDVPSMMAGLLDLANRLVERPVDPVVLAAVVAFGFVFVHPFEDGNGRLHRFLVHWTLARRRFTPDGVILPVSAVMLAREDDYDRALEAFSRPLLRVLACDVDADGVVTVEGETAHHYRYFDATVMAEALYGWVAATIDTELPEELDFLSRYRATVRAMQEIVDMPDRLLDLFIRCCRQNGWVLSAAKRRSHFEMLRDDEVARLETVVRETMTGRVPDRIG